MIRFFFFAFMLLPWMVQAQKNVLSCEVQDAVTRRPLSGAVVTLNAGDLGGLTDEGGHYSFVNLPAGNINITVALPGYETTSQSVQLNANGKTELQLMLNRSNLEIKEVTVQTFTAHRRQAVGQLDIKLRPILNSQEILRMVPGLFMGQHAGGGKAEQIFLRGFDIDHGTDIRLTVDGIPVNIVSHAHGQGYADLHFVIPELVEQVDFEKGPYHTDKGNFATAGWVDFRTKEVLDRNFVKAEAGQYGTARGVVGLNLLGAKARERQQAAYIAGEYSYSDSYFDAPQYFNRANVQGRYSGQLSANTRMNVTGSYFWSRWNHSGQIPDRAVNDGTISFFGSIDPTEGGETSRGNFNTQLVTTTANGGLLKNQLFYSNYNFELYSNFTFFLEDSINGDQIRQKENRNLFGYNGSYSFPTSLFNLKSRTTAGVQYRQDLAENVELSKTLNRVTTINNIQLGDVNEANLGIYINEDMQLSPKVSLDFGIRYDFFNNVYKNDLESSRKQSASAGILSPKINISYTPTQAFQLYLNTGRGFHSNDTRVVVPQDGREILPAAYGSDLGAVWKPLPRLYINTALWYLWLEQEFVYVGDAGVVEPSGRTERYGFDLSARYQLANHLFADVDLNWTNPRSADDPDGENYIPLAPTFTSAGGLSLTDLAGFSGSLRYRYLADRPANEDNSIVAKGYFVTDLQLNYGRKNWTLGLNIQNLFDTRWKETQFATESLLRNETNPVEEIHFTPGTPFFSRLAFTLFF